MGSGNALAKKLTVETGSEPHFHVTDGTYETAPDGTVLFTGYEEIRGELRAIFHVTLTPAVLAKLARAGQHAAADAHNLIMLQGFSDASDDRH